MARSTPPGARYLLRDCRSIRPGISISAPGDSRTSHAHVDSFMGSAFQPADMAFRRVRRSIIALVLVYKCCLDLFQLIWGLEQSHLWGVNSFSLYFLNIERYAVWNRSISIVQGQFIRIFNRMAISFFNSLFSTNFSCRLK